MNKPSLIIRYEGEQLIAFIGTLEDWKQFLLLRDDEVQAPNDLSKVLSEVRVDMDFIDELSNI